MLSLSAMRTTSFQVPGFGRRDWVTPNHSHSLRIAQRYIPNTHVFRHLLDKDLFVIAGLREKLEG